MFVIKNTHVDTSYPHQTEIFVVSFYDLFWKYFYKVYWSSSKITLTCSRLKVFRCIPRTALNVTVVRSSLFKGPILRRVLRMALKGPDVYKVKWTLMHISNKIPPSLVCHLPPSSHWGKHFICFILRRAVELIALTWGNCGKWPKMTDMFETKGNPKCIPHIGLRPKCTFVSPLRLWVFELWCNFNKSAFDLI